jgi:hypothetical protein
MPKNNHFRSSMIADAQKAATAMQSSPLAAKLAAMGFTPATMSQAAATLTDLHAKAEAAHSAWLQASAALGTAAQQFDQTWSSYCNIVRGVTSDATTRKTHGVSSPGLRKTPSYKRPRKEKTATAASSTSTATTATAATTGKQ